MTAATAAEVLDLFAREARVERSRLQPHTRVDELGIASLDLALALFEIEERFGVSIKLPPAGAPLPTVGELTQQVLAGSGPASK